MGLEKTQTHRPGALKQTNKPHKHGRHRSKGSISTSAKGKVSVKTISKKQKRELNKEQRRNQASQIRQNKRDEVLSKKRSLGGLNSAPFLVCILPLNKQIDPNGVLNFLTLCDEEAIVNKSSTGVTHINIPRFKQKFAFVIPTLDNDLAILDTLKVCDTVIFVASAAAGYDFGDEVIDSWGNNVLLSSFAQGLPTPVVVVTELEGIPQKRRNEQKQNIQKLVAKWMPDEKILTLDKNVDAINLLRKIGNQKRKKVVYRDRRPHLYAENVEYIPDNQGSLGTLKVTGYLRGNSLSVNDLVHLPSLGDFQMLQIDAPTDPYAIEKKSASQDAMDASIIRVLEKADPTKQESLESENIPDSMDAEQTWPTEEELKMAENEQKIKKVKKVPKGWSEYQAAWIPDDDVETVSYEDESSEDDSNYMDAMSEAKSEYSDAEEEFDTMTESEIGVSDQQYDQQTDLNIEKEDLEKLKAAKLDSAFPDEIDTPQDTPAHVRFQKYRGLESFRTSPWDPKENLPSDYARIFQFENFDRTRKRILKDRENKDGVLPGWYITIHVKGVSQLLWSTFKETGAPVVVIGLFLHEHKMSVINTILKRTSNYEAPIKSKERLIFQCGYRKFIVNPIFSQHTNGKKHKYERFFQPDSTTVATFYAPIQFPPAPVLCFKEINNKLVLVAHGSLLSCNPDRLVIKRVVLSGHPFKVHKRSAVIRFMFFNREDIVYFKPIKLRTKYGRTGHIKEPLGTHGHMKCVFDGQLKSMDTILMNVYKRIFPKWNFEECIVSCSENLSSMET
ncbi:hypothetical protein ILUMI_25997 [Ignelater luminosus]|uniref:Pre-rRNA-processing protein TSR1 homolog n=1 Tax=Ignelater luminosus TaxID=2038154 RepID=A0A8K0C7E8_IGNLU|nr:hypothetical protein ILUMI_25997 [Ignelater luminosus]